MNFDQFLRSLVIVLGCSSASLLLGCHSLGTSNGSSGMPLADAPTSKVDPETEARSEALHYYLVGQLSYVEEDFNTALENLAKASALAKEDAPLLHVRLAELYLRFGKLDKALEEANLARAQSRGDSYTALLYAGILVSMDKEGEAEPIYKELIESDPDKFDSYILLSSLYLKRKEFDKSLEILNRLVKRMPKEPVGYLYIGRTYELMGQIDKAENAYRKTVALDTSGGRGETDLLRILVQAKRYAEAKKFCEEVLARDPNDVLARKVLGQLMIGENNLDSALEHLQVIESMEEDSADTRYKIALIQIEKQNFKEAERELSLVLAQRPTNSEARYYLASIFAGSGRRKEAVEELLKITPDSDMFVKSRTFAAFILRQDKQLSRAEAAIREALKAAPDNMNILLYLVLILRDDNRPEDAAELLEQALAKEPNNDRLMFNYALVLHDLGKDVEALAWMEKLLVLQPAHSDALNYVAYALADQEKDLDRALTLINKALEIRPNDGFYLDTLGWVLFHSKKLADAEEVLSRASVASNEDVVIVEHYVTVLEAAGKLEQAVSLLKAVVDRGLPANETDKDKIKTLKRLKDRLNRLVERDPKLKEVERSALTDPTAMSSSTDAASQSPLGQ